MEFKSVWFRGNEANWAKVRAYEDIGTLAVDDAGLTFSGKKTTMTIPTSAVRSLGRKRVGRDVVNNWIRVEYESDGEARRAYFVDGGLLGWSGLLGGNKRLFEALDLQTAERTTATATA